VRHMDILQDVNLKLIELFRKEGIAFAYPTQRLYVEQDTPVQSQLIARESAAKSD
jgi:hypothetical protein